MSTAVVPPRTRTPAERETRDPYEPWTKGRRRWRPSHGLWENAILFGVASVAYTVLGLWTLLRKHILVFDGLSRLSHAYFVWWNAPPKLAAIGFVWPPIETLVFLPFAAIKPLATSLVALPITSAIFGAALLVVLNRLFTIVGMAAWQRYSLLVAFGANPMIAFYASNGMAEILYLFLLVGGIYGFIRWYLTRSPGALIFSACFFALGILTRYEVFAWAIILPVSLVLVSIRQRVSRSELEGTLLTFLAPISYGLGLWVFFNWLILGNPFFFFSQQTPGAPLSPGGTTQAIVRTTLTPFQVAEKIAVLNWQLFPPVVLALIALACVAFVRRDLMTMTLIAMLVVNAAFTWLIIVRSGAESYLELRYNMRAMPIAVASVGWLYLLARGRRRTLVWAASLVALVVAIPATAHTMRTFPYQFREVNFINAIEGKGGIPDQLADDRKVASWVKTHVHTQDAILTDDSQTFGAMLLSGRPDLFWDRIDRGDVKWLAARDDPWGLVSYMLVIPKSPDLIVARYPTLGVRPTPGFTRVFRAGKYTIFRVARTAPAVRAR